MTDTMQEEFEKFKESMETPPPESDITFERFDVQLRWEGWKACAGQKDKEIADFDELQKAVKYWTAECAKLCRENAELRSKIKVADNGQTHHADEETLAYIRKLEDELAEAHARIKAVQELVATESVQDTLRRWEAELRRWEAELTPPATDSPSPIPETSERG